MPKTRSEVDRTDKMTEILDAAERRLRAGGYNSLSVAGLARELGIAHNAIYWYFPSKDHLIVATFEHMLHKLLANKPKNGKDVIARVMWFVDQLGELYPLRASMHEQAQRSGVIADYLDDLNQRLRSMAMHALEPHVDAADLELAAASFTATVQGAFLAGTPPKERRRVIRFALESLIASRGE
jgi:AcrR family transcriptional regulator